MHGSRAQRGGQQVVFWPLEFTQTNVRSTSVSIGVGYRQLVTQKQGGS